MNSGKENLVAIPHDAYGFMVLRYEREHKRQRSWLA